MSELLLEKLAANDDLVKQLMSRRKDANKSKIILNGFDNFRKNVKGDWVPKIDNNDVLRYLAKSSGAGIKNQQLEVSSVLDDIARTNKENNPDALKEYDSRMKDAISKIKDFQKKRKKYIAIPTVAGMAAGGGLTAALLSATKIPADKALLPTMQAGLIGSLAGALGGGAYAAHKNKKARKNLYQTLTDDEAKQVLDMKNKILKDQAATGTGQSIKATNTYYY